jgi:hypothetical protein
MLLIEAVKFISHAQRRVGDERSTHCMIRYGNVIADDGVLSAGMPIEEADLNCCPQTQRLVLALARCGSEYQIVQADNSLFLRSADFSAYIPLCDPSALAVPVPDAAIAPLNEEFKTALAVCGSLVKDGASTLLQSCIQLDTGSAISTNGSVILQYWHGNDFPSGLLIPIQFAAALKRIKKPLHSFGFSKETLTVWFDDRSWLRTRLFQNKIPSMISKLVDDIKSTPFPKGFFEQADIVSHFSEDGDLHLNDEVIRSHATGNIGCYQSYPLKDIPNCVVYKASSLAAIAKYATHFNCCEHLTMIYGPNMRGAVAHKFMRPIPKPKVREYGDGFRRYEAEPCSKCINGVCTDDCIPF